MSPLRSFDPSPRVAFGVVHSPYLHSHVFGFMPSRMDSLGVGCFLALAEGTALFERIYAKVSSLWWVAALSFCVGTPLLLWRSPQISHAVGLSLDAAMMGFFILWAARNPETVVGRFLNNRVIAEVGESFGRLRVAAQREAVQRAALVALGHPVVAVPQLDHDVSDLASLLAVGAALRR